MTLRSFRIKMVDTSKALSLVSPIRLLFTVGTACLLVSLLAVAVSAQVSSTVTITGTVSDPTNAVVPDADVTIINNGTGALTSTKSNGTGAFVTTGLPPGNYTVKVARAGFKTYVESNLTIGSGGTRTVYATLAVGETTQVTEVQATAVAVQTTTSELSTTIDTKQIADLPLNGRNFQGLAALMPGVVNTSAGSSLGSGGNITQNVLSVNGMGPGAGVTYFLDGIWDANVSSGNQLSIMPNPDMIQEVNVLQNNYDVKYSLAGASVVVVQSKSGTSDLHGAAFEYLRNAALNARNAFASVVPQYNKNIYGYSIGGPVYLPKVYPKRDRTFFFVNQQWVREIVGQTITGLAPTAGMHDGTFTTSITDPTTGLPFSQTSPGIYQIPANRINAGSKLLLDALSPIPNVNGTVNYRNTLPVRTDQRDDEFRVDHNLTAGGRVRLSGAYYAEQMTSLQPTTTRAGSAAAGLAAPIYPSAAQNSVTPGNKVGRLELTAIITPQMVNQFRATVNIYISELRFAPYAIWQISQVPGFTQTLPFANNDPRLPYITFGNGYPSVGDVAGTPGGRNSDLDRAVADDWSWSHGKHFLEAGLTYMVNTKRQTRPTVGFANGLWNFSGKFTGNSIADFLLGDANTFSQYNQGPRFYFKGPWSSYYVGDQWKVTPRLTLSLGLRATFLPLISTGQPSQAPIFLPSKYDASAAPIVATNGQITATPNYNPTNGIVLNGVNGQPLNNKATDEKQWYVLPQFGFAWNVFGDGKTSLRGGYSITTAQNISVNGALCCQSNPPLAQNVNLVSPQFPNPAGAASTKTVQALSTLDPTLQSPQIQTFSLSIQHEFPGNWIASVAGSGSLVRHLPDAININTPHPTGGFDYNPAINTGGSPYYYAPYQGYAAISSETSQETASYYAGMLSLKHAMGHGVFFTTAYTWSHAISAFRNAQMFSSGGGQQNPYNWKAGSGNSLANIPQVFNATLLYDLPFFKGSHGWRSVLLGGWKLDEIATVQSGASLDVGMSVANQGLATRPNEIAPITYSKLRSQWFSTSSFAKPAAGYFGTAPTGIIRGPGLINFDTGFYKEFAITERHVFELRGELFNTINHTNYSTVNTTFGSAAFGLLTAARDPRIAEISARFRF